MTHLPATSSASCVAVVIRSVDAEMFPPIAASLKRRGVGTVVKLEVETSPAAGWFSSTLVKADRAVSRWLPGSRRPARVDVEGDCEWPAPARDEATSEQLDADAVIAVGPAAASPLPASIQVAELYALDVGAHGLGFPDVPGSVEVLNRQSFALLRLTAIAGTNSLFRGGEMAVQAHARSIDRTGATLMASLPAFLDAALRPGPASATPARDSLSVSAGSFWRMAFRHLAGLALGLAERLLFRFQWVLAMMPAPEPGRNPDWSALRPILQPMDRIWADPFLVQRNGSTWLFFEDAPFRSAKGGDVGHLSVVEITEHGIVGEPIVILDMPTHLSYPHVFEHDGDWYLLPETASLGRVELHRCTRWPDRWEPHSILIDDYRGYDASIVRSGDLFWMFVARRVEGVGTTDMLDLFSAPSPLGPWAPHPQSPVVQDVRSARPGGRILKRAGQLIRPAQDSSGGLYGRALRLQRVTRLDGHGYEEQRGPSLEPNIAAGAIGIHSLAWDDNVIVVDVCRRIWRSSVLRRFNRPLRAPLVIETGDRCQ